MRTLAKQWVSGGKVNWQSLYHPYSPKRIALPTYPFARERYWIDIENIRSDDTISFNTEPKDKNTNKVLSPEYSDDSKKLITHTIKKIVSDVLRVNITHLNEDALIDEFGVDSILLMEIITKISEEYRLNLGISDVKQLLTIQQMADYIYTQCGNKKDMDSPEEFKKGHEHYDTSKSSYDKQINASQVPYYSRFIEDYHYAFSMCRKYKNFFIQSSQNINVEVITCGEGETLIFLPPIFSLVTSWMHQIVKFSQIFKVIVFHYPGYGRSEYSSKHSNFNDIAESIIECIDILNIHTPYHLVGWSMGGLISQIISLNKTQRIKTLTLVNTTSRLEEQDSTDNLNRIITLLMKDFESHVPDAMRSKKEGKIDFIKATYSNTINLQYVEQVLQFDFRNQVSMISAPTLIVAGGEDVLTPPRYSEYLHENIKDSEYHLLKKGGHYIPLQNHKFFNTTLKAFFKKIG
ncbi:MAG: alpha/beta fold hydrolase [bacterium]